MSQDEEALRTVASWHEAGHVVMAYSVGLKVSLVTLNPQQSGVAGRTEYIPDGEVLLGQKLARACGGVMDELLRENSKAAVSEMVGFAYTKFQVDQTASLDYQSMRSNLSKHHIFTHGAETVIYAFIPLVYNHLRHQTDALNKIQSALIDANELCQEQIERFTTGLDKTFCNLTQGFC